MNIRNIYLWQLILLLVTCSSLLVFISSIASSYFVNKQQLIDASLESNYNYAKKLAATTDLYIANIQLSLKHTADVISKYMDDHERLLEHAHQLRTVTHMFNSIYITNTDGLVLSTSPESLNLVGTILTSDAIKTVIREKKPYISAPFMSNVTKRLIVTISQPIIHANGEFLGVIGGTIYLREGNFLDNVLGDHFYEDGSYVFVVDERGMIIYHRNPDRINDDVSNNKVVQEMMKGNSGSQIVTNSLDQEMLAGYAHIPAAKWGVVSQRPIEVGLNPLGHIMNRSILYSLPFFAINILLAWVLSRNISRPLNQLANVATQSLTGQQAGCLNDVQVWYYEGIHLKKVMDRSLGMLNERVQMLLMETATDPLTKLLNRRALAWQFDHMRDSSQRMAIIILDIDHFKHVNDTYGHSVGDEVLKFLAEQILDVVGEKGLSFRYGGEEFCILLPQETKHQAYEIAEKLRTRLESQTSPAGYPISISAGIAFYPKHTAELDQLIDKADQALYDAKKSGRNQTIMYRA